MAFWQRGAVVDLLLLTVLLAVAWLLRTVVLPRIRKDARAHDAAPPLHVPDALVAGVLGFAFGPSGAGWLPFDPESLERIVYHLFAVVFIAQSLRAPPQVHTGESRSVALAIPTLAVLQLVVGLGVVAVFMGSADPVHPGFGLLMMLGFLQGPGQALALGGAWETQGLANGSELGLAFAAIGFALCGLVGIPLVALARRLGWDDTMAVPAPASAPPDEIEDGESNGSALQLDTLAVQVLAIGCVYAATWLVLLGAQRALPDGHPLAATLWGFHFIVGAVIGIGVRRVFPRVQTILDDGVQNRISVIAVDYTTAGALAAVQIAVVWRWWSPILTASLAGLGISLWFCLWIGRRAYVRDRFAHALVLFGAATGTLATGLALLRMVDPWQRSPASRNAVMGMAASIIPTAPLMLGFLPLAVGLWSSGTATALQVSVGILLVYLGALAIAWRKLAAWQPASPWWHPWPADKRRAP